MRMYTRHIRDDVSPTADANEAMSLPISVWSNDASSTAAAIEAAVVTETCADASDNFMIIDTLFLCW